MNYMKVKHRSSTGFSRIQSRFFDNSGSISSKSFIFKGDYVKCFKKNLGKSTPIKYPSKILYNHKMKRLIFINMDKFILNTFAMIVPENLNMVI